ncbi:MAG: hypothetical protein ABIT07_08215 [Ferruginibacter sp.]
MTNDSFLPKCFKATLIILVFFYSSACGQNPYINVNTDIASINNKLNAKLKPLERFDLLNRKAGYFVAIGKLDSVSFVNQELLKITQALQNDSLAVITYNLIGSYFGFKGAHTNALEYLFKGMPFAKQTKNNGYLCSLNLDAAWSYTYFGDFSSALKYIRIAQSFLKDSSLLKTNLPLQVYSVFTEIFTLTGKIDSALYYNQRAYDANLKVKDDFQAAGIFNSFGRIYQVLNDADLAEVYYKKGIRFTDSLSLLSASADVKYSYATFLYSRAEYIKTLNFCKQSLDISIQQHNYRLSVDRAELLKRTYISLLNKDSIIYYALLKDAFTDSLNDETKLSKLQDITINERLHEIEEEGKQKQLIQERQQNIQYTLIALGLVGFIILFLLLSRSIITNTKVISFLAILALLIVFEFINLLMHPFLERVTHHQPVLMLAALVCIAALLIPIHHQLEKWMTHTMVEKNKRIRLAAAKKTIATLEG